MVDKYLKRRAKEKNYPKEALDDILHMNELLYKSTSFIQNLLDETAIDDAYTDEADSIISELNDSTFEDD